MQRHALCSALLCTLALSACSTTGDQQAKTRSDAAGEVASAPAANEAVKSLDRVQVTGSLISAQPAPMEAYDYAPATPPSTGYSQPANTEKYAAHADNPVHRASEEPVSTFSIDVDTGSYANVRRMLREGVRPPADAVRAEEMINYLRYEKAFLNFKFRFSNFKFSFFEFPLNPKIPPNPGSDIPGSDNNSLIHHLPIMCNTASLHNIIFKIQIYLSFLCNDKLQEIAYIFSIHLTRIAGCGGRQSAVAHNRHTIIIYSLIILCMRCIAACCCCYINNHTAGFHINEHGIRNKYGRFLSRYLCRCYYYIGLCHTISNFLLLSLFVFFCLLYGIATRFASICGAFHFYKLSTQAHHFFFYSRPCIKYFHHSAQSARSGYGLQACHTCAEY